VSGSSVQGSFRPTHDPLTAAPAQERKKRSKINCLPLPISPRHHHSRNSPGPAPEAPPFPRLYPAERTTLALVTSRHRRRPPRPLPRRGRHLHRSRRRRRILPRLRRRLVTADRPLTRRGRRPLGPVTTPTTHLHRRLIQAARTVPVKPPPQTAPSAEASSCRHPAKASAPDLPLQRLACGGIRCWRRRLLRQSPQASKLRLPLPMKRLPPPATAESE
jgi:hypothetical protein